MADDTKDIFGIAGAADIILSTADVANAARVICRICVLTVAAGGVSVPRLSPRAPARARVFPILFN